MALPTGSHVVHVEVCEGCITSIMDNDGADADIADEMCRELGSEIADHICDGSETGEPCACACRTAS